MGRPTAKATHDRIVALRTGGRCIDDKGRMARCSESQVKRVWSLVQEGAYHALESWSGLRTRVDGLEGRCQTARRRPQAAFTSRRAALVYGSVLENRREGPQPRSPTAATASTRKRDIADRAQARRVENACTQKFANFLYVKFSS